MEGAKYVCSGFFLNFKNSNQINWNLAGIFFLRNVLNFFIKIPVFNCDYWMHTCKICIDYSVWRCGVVVITIAQLHSKNSEQRFYTKVRILRVKDLRWWNPWIWNQLINHSTRTIRHCHHHQCFTRMDIWNKLLMAVLINEGVIF